MSTRDDQCLTGAERKALVFVLWSRVEQDFGPVSFAKIPVSDDPDPGVEDGGDTWRDRLPGWIALLLPALIVAAALVLSR